MHCMQKEAAVGHTGALQCILEGRIELCSCSKHRRRSWKYRAVGRSVPQRQFLLDTRFCAAMDDDYGEAGFGDDEFGDVDAEEDVDDGQVC